MIKLNGNETCAYCGKRADEIPNFRNWVYLDDIRYCTKHGAHGTPDYVKGNLDINSAIGRGRSGELLVIKALNIEKEKDCNRISCAYYIDMYHNEYGKIDVKTSVFNCEYNKWAFGFRAKKEADTYICVALSSNKKDVKHVWVVPNEGKIGNLIGLKIYDTYNSLYNHKKWEIDVKKWNKIWHNMNLNNCNTLVNKNKDNYNENINNIVKHISCVVDKSQHKLNDYI